MTVPPLIAAAILGLVEGITEFIPVSSTGHLILVGDWLGFDGPRAQVFEVFIQLGAILAIVWLYRARLFARATSVVTEPKSRRFALNLAIAFLPAAIVGLLTHHWIKAHLFNPITVALALIAGGIAILVVESLHPRTRVTDVDDIAPPSAFGVGLAQVLSLFPGVSRSGATIMGGYLLGLSRTAATEFSFFLAIPVMLAATMFDLLKNRALLSAADVPVFAVGFAVAFVSALVIVRAFVAFVSRSSFRPFAWYRIGFGAVVLAWYLTPGA